MWRIFYKHSKILHIEWSAIKSYWFTLNPFAGITTLIYTLITLAPISYFRSLVVRAVHRHRTGVGSIPAGGPYSWWIFLNCSRLEFRDVYNFHSILRHINPLENSPHRVKCHENTLLSFENFAQRNISRPRSQSAIFRWKESSSRKYIQI